VPTYVTKYKMIRISRDLMYRNLHLNVQRVLYAIKQCTVS